MDGLHGRLIPLDLQRFAEPETKTAEAAAEGDGKAAETLTFEEHLKGNKDYQAEFDRRVTKALETAKAKWQQETASAVEAAKTEAAKLAKMTSDEKEKHEREKREAELSRRETELTRRELKSEAAQTLAERGLPKELLDVVNLADAALCKASIEAAETAFRTAVQAGVEARRRSDVASLCFISNGAVR